MLHPTVISSVCLSALLLQTAAFADDEPHASDPVPAKAESAEHAAKPEMYRPFGRQLGGHTYLPVISMVGPFATTSFGTFLTAGAGTTTGSVTLQIPNTSVPPQTFTGSVSYAALGGFVGFEYAFLRDFAARVVLSETLYSGVTGAAAAVVGTNARLGGDVGLTGGLPIGKSVRISGVFDANYAPRIGILLGPAIRGAYDSCSMGVGACRFEFSKLFQQKNVLRLTPGVAAAWTPTKPLGLTGNVSYSYSSIDTVGSGVASASALSFGLAADFDFLELTPVPVGLQATWNTETPITSSELSAFTDLGGGVFYTGREDLALGLQIVDRRFRVVPQVDVSWSTFVTTFGLRYYWR